MSWNLLTIREFLLRQCFRQLALAVVCTEQAHDLVIQLDFFLNTAVLYWLLRGHMTSINKPVSPQKFLTGQDCKVAKHSFINWSLKPQKIVDSFNASVHSCCARTQYSWAFAKNCEVSNVENGIVFLCETRIQCVLYGMISFFCYTGNRGNETLCRDGKQNYI